MIIAILVTSLFNIVHASSPLASHNQNEYYVKLSDEVMHVQPHNDYNSNVKVATSGPTSVVSLEQQMGRFTASASPAVQLVREFLRPYMMNDPFHSFFPIPKPSRHRWACYVKSMRGTPTQTQTCYAKDYVLTKRSAEILLIYIVNAFDKQPTQKEPVKLEETVMVHHPIHGFIRISICKEFAMHETKVGKDYTRENYRIGVFFEAIGKYLVLQLPTTDS